MIDWSQLRTAEQSKADADVEAARAYLAQTDFYVIRAADPSDGKPMPAEVEERRRAARELIRRATDA